MSIKLIALNQYVRPKLTENKSKNWVLNGKNNEFYDYIIARYNGSPTNSAIINAYVDMFIGNGLAPKHNNVTGWVKLKQVLSNKDLRRLVTDFVMFNECMFDVVKAKNGKGLGALYHIPIEKTAPSLVNEENEIDSYWFSYDWKKIYSTSGNNRSNIPVQYPAWGFDMGEKEHFYKLQPYKAGSEYFSAPDYLAGLPYCEMEEEIANYYVSHIKNGLSFGYIVNIPNGKNLSEGEQDEMERKIKEKLTGSSNAGKLILSFNDSDGQAITVEVVQINDSHKQWEYLTSESRQQIMTAHRVVSPMLFGIKDSTGFGNNADELDTAEAQLYKRIIQPKQKVFLEALDEILNAYDIHVELYFRPLTEQSTSVSMSSHVCCSDEKKNIDLDSFLAKGETIDTDKYDLVHEIEVDYEEEEKINFASTGMAFPNAKSEQDSDDIVIRYKYVGSESPQREFCQKMMSAGKVYRKEDIIAMDNKVVNAGWGANGADTYSIWLYKGGGDCHHKWNRVIYVKKGVKIDVNSPLAEQISTSEARRKGYSVPTNDTLVSIEPRNMTNNGFLKPR
jgi:hypothetical protein